MLNKKKSQIQEKRIAKEMGGNLVPASGSMWSAKADVKTSKFLLEAKTTGKEFYSLTFATWDKVYNEALRDGNRIPLMQIDLQSDRLAIIDYNDFVALGIDKFYDEQNNTKVVHSKSFRVTDIYSLNSQNNKYSEFPRYEIVFSTEEVRLVVLYWTDFLTMLKKIEVFYE